MGFRIRSARRGNARWQSTGARRPSASDLMPTRPINQVKRLLLHHYIQKGWYPEAALTPVTELGKVQLTAMAPAAVPVLHPAAEVVAL